MAKQSMGEVIRRATIAAYLCGESSNRKPSEIISDQAIRDACDAAGFFNIGKASLDAFRQDCITNLRLAEQMGRLQAAPPPPPCEQKADLAMREAQKAQFLARQIKAPVMLLPAAEPASEPAQADSPAVAAAKRHGLVKKAKAA